MRLTKRSEYDRHGSGKLSQWLAGCAGAGFTTLPCFIVLPVWFFVVDNYRVVDRDGNDNDVACGVICFVGGILVWAVAAAFLHLSAS
jgi:hypothetical protein